MLVRTIVPNTEGSSFVSQQYIYAYIIKTGHAQCVMCVSSPMLLRSHGGSNFFPVRVFILRWLPRVITNIVLIERELENET